MARHGYTAGKDMAKDPRGARRVGTRRDQPQCDRLSLPLRSSHALLTTCVSERQPASWSHHTLVAKVLYLNTTPRHLTVPLRGAGPGQLHRGGSKKTSAGEDSPLITWHLKTRRFGQRSSVDKPVLIKPPTLFPPTNQTFPPTPWIPRHAAAPSS